MTDMRGVVKFELSDRTEILRYDYNALCDFDQATDGNIMDLEQQGMGPSDMRAFIWAGMDGDASFEDAGDIVDDVIEDQGIEYLGEKINEAITSIIPQGTADESGADIKN